MKRIAKRDRKHTRFRLTRPPRPRLPQATRDAVRTLKTVTPAAPAHRPHPKITQTPGKRSRRAPCYPLADAKTLRQ